MSDLHHCSDDNCPTCNAPAPSSEVKTDAAVEGIMTDSETGDFVGQFEAMLDKNMEIAREVFEMAGMGSSSRIPLTPDRITVQEAAKVLLDWVEANSCGAGGDFGDNIGPDGLAAIRALAEGCE